MEIKSFSNVDFNNTEIAFSYKSDKELRKMAWLFSMMNNPMLTKITSNIALKAVEWSLPLAAWAVKHTIFEQFVGGTTPLNCIDAIKKLKDFNTLTILDYGAEGKGTEEDFNKTLEANKVAINFASRNAIPIISIKVTGLGKFNLLEKIQANSPLTAEEHSDYEALFKRVQVICHTAANAGVAVFIDAEESWIQDAIDRIADQMMMQHNKERVVVYNTFQMYRHDRLAFLKKSFELAKEKGYLLGAKLVRGAYMEKERKRAEEMRYPTPINPDKVATDKMYNDALLFCIANYTQIASCNATHNRQSSLLQAELMDEMNIPKNHPHLFFCQLYGMSDNITFNLAAAGYNVAKYMPYGSVKDVIPYLIRRANENSAVSGDMSREYKLIKSEVDRRKSGK